MIEKLKKISDSIDADFSDIRYEVRKDTRVVFRGKDLSETGANSTDGFVVRVLKNGGFGFSAVTKFEDIATAVTRATDAAETMAGAGASPVTLEQYPVMEDSITPDLNEDPLNISAQEKVEIVEKYNRMLLNEPEIASTSLVYSEVNRDRYYVNSEGAMIDERLITTNISGAVIARRGSLTQDMRVSVGGSDGFSRVRGREDVFLKRARIARELLDAEPVRGGKYRVVMSPLLAGVFTHEAFGHFSEADIIEKNPSLRSKMELGANLGSAVVTIIADSTLPNQLGFYRYDDEGVAVKPVTLMEKGILTGRLHSRRTAAAFGEDVTGHCIAEDFRYAPIVRMGTIFIGAGTKSFDELLKDLDDGLYLIDGKGGQTAGENFTFGAQYGYIVKNGQIGPMIRDINIMGNLFSTLKNIVAVSDEVELSERGGCGKGQTNIRSNLGGPHVLVEDMVVGGVS
jgi:TldD protein